MNFKEFEDGLQVEIEISEKVSKSLMRHPLAVTHPRFPACRRAGTATDDTDVKCSERWKNLSHQEGPERVFPRSPFKNFLENAFHFI
jgi:hypothetical protein